MPVLSQTKEKEDDEGGNAVVSIQLPQSPAQRRRRTPSPCGDEKMTAERDSLAATLPGAPSHNDAPVDPTIPPHIAHLDHRKETAASAPLAEFWEYNVGNVELEQSFHSRRSHHSPDSQHHPGRMQRMQLGIS